MDTLINLGETAYTIQANSSLFFYLACYFQFLLALKVIEFFWMRIFKNPLMSHQGRLIVIAITSWFFWEMAITNCQNKENNLKIFGLQRDFTQQELRSSSRRISGIYHPDKETGNAEKFQLIAELKEVFENHRNARLIKLYEQYGDAVDLVSIKLDHLTRDVEYNIVLYQLFKHGSISLILMCLTMFLFWDSGDRGFTQYVVCGILGCMNICVKLWVFNSDELITRAQFIDLKSYLGMEFAIKPELYEFADMLLVVGLMIVYMFGKLFSTPLDIQCMIIFDQLNMMTRTVLENYRQANKGVKDAVAKGFHLTEETKQNVKEAHLEMHKVMDKAYGDTDNRFVGIIDRMSAGGATVDKIGAIASKCFSYGIQFMIFGPLVIGILAKFFPRLGMMFDM